MLNNPNKHIRKAIFNAVSSSYPIFDSQVPNSNTSARYCIMSSQSKQIDKANKCDYYWETEILLQLIDIYKMPGNSGSRVAIDDMENDIFALISPITIDGYSVITRNYDFPDNLDNVTDTQIVYRNYIRLSLLLKET